MSESNKRSLAALALWRNDKWRASLLRKRKISQRSKRAKKNYSNAALARWKNNDTKKKYISNHWSRTNMRSCTSEKISVDHKKNWRNNSSCSKAHMKMMSKRAWENKDALIKAIFSGMKIHPNKPEKKLLLILRSLFKNDYKFVGDGKFVINGYVPDFISVNGQKRIIELYGDFYHANPKMHKANAKILNRVAKNIWAYDRKRINSFKKSGYKTLIIWEHELENYELLSKKLTQFN